MWSKVEGKSHNDYILEMTTDYFVKIEGMAQITNFWNSFFPK